MTMSMSVPLSGKGGLELVIDLHDVEKWVRGYRQAWLSNDPRDIRSLFVEDAVYYSEPYAQPQRGLQAIVEDWLARKDEPDDTTFEFGVLATTNDLAFVRGLTTYKEPPRTYYNLWVIRLNRAGECTEFTEWWMETDKPASES